MKLAIFKNLPNDFETYQEECFENYEDYVRISEYVDVEFPPLKNADVLNKQVAALKKAKQDIQAATELKLQDIDYKISKLLALPHKEG